MPLPDRAVLFYRVLVQGLLPVLQPSDCVAVLILCLSRSLMTVLHLVPASAAAFCRCLVAVCVAVF